MQHLTRLAVLAAMAGALTPDASAQNSFTIVALPDTQNYVNSSANAPLFTMQTMWVRDQILNQGNPRNIVFVSHLGDVVNTAANTVEWDRALTAMNVLDSVIAYGVVPGNHDYGITGVKASGTAAYLARFGPQRFAGQSFFGGADPSGNNTYQVFTAAGREFLHIGLEWQPASNVTNGPTRDPSPIAWARQVLLDHPGMPTIVSTHEHVDDDPPGRSGAGNQTWDQLIRDNDQIFMVMNGHFHSLGGTNDGEYHQTSTNIYGNQVIEMLADYQDYPRGGDGWLRLVTFDFDNNEVRFETFSPVLNQFQTETVQQVGPFASQFALPVNFAERFMFVDPPQPPEPPREIFGATIIRQGLNGYAGTLDKEIRSSGNDAANGNATSISVDGDDGSPGLQPNDGLIRFENFVGNGPGQIAAGSTIDSAALRLNVTNPGSGFDVFVMTADWNESTTWASFGGDGITPGVEAAATAIRRIGADNAGENIPGGILEIDITSTVRDWINGGLNRGLGLAALPAGTNGIDFTSSESPTPPELVIRTLLPNIELLTFTQGIAGYAGAVDTQISQSAATSGFGTATGFSVDNLDGTGPNHVLIRFDDIFGPGRVAPNADIARAFLTVNASDAGDGANLHRMLQPWNDALTWDSAFGGNGVQANGVEAVAAPDASQAGVTGVVQIDVTASLLAWQADPAENFGWVLLPLGSNGWDIASSDAAQALRPTLTVAIDTTPRGCNPADLSEAFGTLDINDVLVFAAAFNAMDPAADYFPEAGDGTFDINDVLVFAGAFNAGCP